MRERRREEMTEGGRRIRGERKGWRNGEGDRSTGNKGDRKEMRKEGGTS